MLLTIVVDIAASIVLAAALMLDWLFGEPDMLWRRIPHPVVLFGRAIGLAEQFGNRRKAFNGLTRRRASSRTRKRLGWWTW